MTELIEPEYERRAWEHLRAELSRPTRSTRLPDGVRKRLEPAKKRAEQTWENAPGSDSLEAALVKALEGLKGLVIDPAMRSVRLARVVEAFAERGHDISDLRDVATLDLEVIDQVMPPLRFRYSAGAAAEGAAAGVVVTGGTLLATAGSVASAGVATGPGIATIAGAMAVDTATGLAATSRAVAHTAAYYGYDARLPQEELYVMAVFYWSTATQGSTKAVAFTQLSRITQQLIRGAAWKEPNQHAVVGVLNRLAAQLGLRLTKRKLGQAIPVLGIAVGAGLNAQMVRSIAHDAQLLYRARFLAEKHNLDIGVLIPGAGQQARAADAQPDTQDRIDIPELGELLEQEDPDEERPA